MLPAGDCLATANSYDHVRSRFVCGDLHRRSPWLSVTSLAKFLQKAQQAMKSLKLPEVTTDGRSFAPQIKGQPGQPREWVYVQLDDKRYVRNAGWKLTGDGHLFDMREAPFQEIGVKDGAADDAATSNRAQLQAVLDQLNANRTP